MPIVIEQVDAQISEPRPERPKKPPAAAPAAPNAEEIERMLRRAHQRRLRLTAD
jgi:hypothetical protein